MTTTTTRTVTVDLPLTDELLRDILTTAVEGGSGYWLVAGDVKRDADQNVLAVLDCTDAETGEPFEPASFRVLHLAADGRSVIDLANVASGIRRVLAVDPDLPKFARPNARFAALTLEAVRQDDASYIDADAADVIVQMGFFGQLIYG